MDHQLTHLQKRLLSTKKFTNKRAFKAPFCQNRIIIRTRIPSSTHHSQLKLAFSRKLDHFERTWSKTKPLPPTKGIISRYSIEIKRGKRIDEEKWPRRWHRGGMLGARLLLSFSFQLVVRKFYSSLKILIAVANKIFHTMNV